MAREEGDGRRRGESFSPGFPSSASGVTSRGKKVEIEKNETTFVSLTQAVVAVPAGAQGPEGPSRGGGEDD